MKLHSVQIAILRIEPQHQTNPCTPCRHETRSPTSPRTAFKPHVTAPNPPPPRSQSFADVGTAGFRQELGSLPAQKRRDALDANARGGWLLRRKRETRKNKAEHLGGAQPYGSGQVPVDHEGAVLRRGLHRRCCRHRAR